MKKKFYVAAGLIAGFILWTLLLMVVDVRAIGPNGSVVGFSTLNRFVHNLTGTNLTLYNITDWLGLVPIAFVIGFAALGLVQLIGRRHLLKVDFSILILGIFFIVVMAVFVFFEMFPINYRPILINGYLEASYPSSTTLLVMCVMSAVAMQLNSRIKNSVIRNIVIISIITFIVFMVVGRVISGVHWFSDIIGGVLISAGLVSLYHSIVNISKK